MQNHLTWKIVSKIAKDYAKSPDAAKINPGPPIKKTPAQIRLEMNFGYESIQYGLEFIERLTFGKLPIRFAIKLAVFLHNKKLLSDRIYEKHPYFKAYKLLKSQVETASAGAEYGKAGKVAEEYLAFFTGMNKRHPKLKRHKFLGDYAFVHEPDFKDEARTYEFKLCLEDNYLLNEYRKAYVQANLSHYLANEGLQDDGQILIIELFALKQDMIYTYKIQPDNQLTMQLLKNTILG